MSSTITVRADAFDPALISPESRAFNAQLSSNTAAQSQWYQVGIAKYRKQEEEEGAIVPVPTLVASAVAYRVPSRDPGRSVPCRLFRPQNDLVARALFMHIHGGGWVLGSENHQDFQLQRLADSHSIAVLSVGYRLAPEHPFPAGPQDCYDVAEWLVRNALDRLQAPLAFIGGESAGGHLTALTTLHLLQHPEPRYSEFRLQGLVLHYGCYSMRWLPSVHSLAKLYPHLVLSLELMSEFVKAFRGDNVPDSMLDDPRISPLYADLPSLRGKLPPALFTCGTEDYLLDDTLFMSTRWMVAGGHATVTIVNGAAHGYTNFDPNVEGSGARVGQEATDIFLKEKLS